MLHWVEAGRTYGPLEIARDQELRTEVFDAVQGVLDSYDLLLTPTLACLPVDNAADGNTLGSGVGRRRAVEPADRLVPDLPVELHGPPSGIGAGGAGRGLPVGLQIIGRKFADADVIAASAAYERARPWSQHYAIAAGREV